MSMRKHLLLLMLVVTSSRSLAALEIDRHAVVDGPTFWAAMEGTWTLDLDAARQAGMPVTRVMEDEAGSMYWHWSRGRMQRWMGKDQKTDVAVSVEAVTPQNLTLLIGSPLPPEALPTRASIPKWVPTRVTLTPTATGVMVDVPPVLLNDTRFVPWRFYLRRTAKNWVAP